MLMFTSYSSKAERSRAKLHSISQLTAHRTSMLELKASFGAKRSNLRWCTSEIFGSVERFIITRWDNQPIEAHT